MGGVAARGLGIELLNNTYEASELDRSNKGVIFAKSPRDWTNMYKCELRTCVARCTQSTVCACSSSGRTDARHPVHLNSKLSRYQIEWIMVRTPSKDESKIDNVLYTVTWWCNNEITRLMDIQCRWLTTISQQKIVFKINFFEHIIWYFSTEKNSALNTICILAKIFPTYWTKGDVDIVVCSIVF